MAVGLLESFGLIEEFGRLAMDEEIITIDDIIFSASAKKRKGCRSIASRLTAEDNQKIMDIGRRIKKWRDER